MRYVQLGLWIVVLSSVAWSQDPAPVGAGADGGPSAAVIHYRFDASSAGNTVSNRVRPEFAARLEGGAEIRPADATGPAVLALDGRTGYVQISGSEGLHIGATGFSAVATVRFADAGTAEGQPETHDMILFKPNEYLFGRTGSKLYFNIRIAGEWSGGVLGGVCRPGGWTHAAVIVERIDEPPQGRVGYFVRLYQDGQMVASREVLNGTGDINDNPLHLGKGWGGPWFLRGEMAHVRAYDRALTPGELNALLQQETLAKVVYRRTAAPDPGFAPLLAEARAAVAAVPAPRRVVPARLLAAAEQALSHVNAQSALLPFLASVRDLAGAATPDPLGEFARRHPDFTFMGNDTLSLAFFAARPGIAALCSLFDLTSGRELLGDQRALWALTYDPPGGGDTRTLDSSASGLTASLSADSVAGAAVLTWTHEANAEHPFSAVVRAELRLAGPRLAVTLSVENRSSDVALREVRFPIVRLRRLEDGTDRLFVPRMSGVVHDNPVRSHLTYDGAYPSGAAHMQFFAYYDDRSGVYVACEDGMARSKDLRAVSDTGDGELSYLWCVGCPGRGGNGFASSGPAVVERFAGDWFDAAQIYKRFAKTAAWWPTSRSRADTPAWYRELCVWFIGNANTPKAVDDLIAMREELGLPIGLHWYGWNTEPFDDDYPHFTPRDGFAETVARLQARGIYVKPYINGRLWETHDRGDEDFEYTSVALPATVKDRQGRPVTEGYNRRAFSPMCPTTPRWQQTMADLCAQVAGHGVAGIYLDQISAARPRLCFDPTHPHAAGAGEAWLEQGYWPMLTAIRQNLRQRYPQVILNSEDAAEPYVHLLDGCLPWRFLDIGHVPAYQSIYAGRIQLTSRHYDDTTYDALFPKAAEQMLYGEQIGWFGLHRLRSNVPFSVFVKKLAHARQAFLPFFNEGDMLKPAPFVSTVPSVTADWGFYGPRVITTPALLHSAWRLGGSVAVLFANTSCDPVTATLAPSAAAWGFREDGVRLAEFVEGTQPMLGDWRPGQPRAVSVPGYSLAAWLMTGGNGGESDAAARVDSTTALFAALKGFDDAAGMTPERRRSERAQRDPWTVPEAPPRSAIEWIPAATAAKLLQARTADDGSYVGWIGSSSALCFGPVDFGEADGGKAMLEYEVAVPAGAANRRIQFMEAVDGRGVPIASGKLESTGDYRTFTVQRTPLPAGLAGRKNVVVQFSGSGSGLCNLRRWRLVREP